MVDGVIPHFVRSTGFESFLRFSRNTHWVNSATIEKIYPTYFVEADAVSKVGILLGKEIGVLLLEGGVVHDVLRVADHVGDLIRLDKQTNNTLILKILMAGGTTRRFTFSSAFLLVALSIQSASSRPFLKQMYDKTQCLLVAGQNDKQMGDARPRAGLL